MVEEMALFTPLTAGGMGLSCATTYICKGGRLALLRIGRRDSFCFVLFFGLTIGF